MDREGGSLPQHARQPFRRFRYQSRLIGERLDRPMPGSCFLFVGGLKIAQQRIKGRSVVGKAEDRLTSGT